MQENNARKDLTKFFLSHIKIYNLDEGTAILGIRTRSTLCGEKKKNTFIPFQIRISK